MASPVQPLIPPAPPILTLVQKQAKALALLNTSSQALFNQMKTAYFAGYNNVWNNPDGLTPQQVCDAFGTGAAEAFRRAAVLATALNAAVPGTVIIVPTKSWTVNSDGSITIAA